VGWSRGSSALGIGVLGFHGDAGVVSEAVLEVAPEASQGVAEGVDLGGAEHHCAQNEDEEDLAGAGCTHGDDPNSIGVSCDTPGMHLLLMRHGEAVDDSDGQGDGARWLTAKGRRVTREVAAHVAKHRPPAMVITSPLVRATQTAEILVGAVGLEDGVVVDGHLASGDVAAILRGLTRYKGQDTIAVVGHEPTLSILTRRLLGDLRWPGFEKSGVCALQWNTDGKARFLWALSPKKLRVIDDLAKFHE